MSTSSLLDEWQTFAGVVPNSIWDNTPGDRRTPWGGVYLGKHRSVGARRWLERKLRAVRAQRVTCCIFAGPVTQYIYVIFLKLGGAPSEEISRHPRVGQGYPIACTCIKAIHRASTMQVDSYNSVRCARSNGRKRGFGLTTVPLVLAVISPTWVCSKM